MSDFDIKGLYALAGLEYKEDEDKDPEGEKEEDAADLPQSDDSDDTDNDDDANAEDAEQDDEDDDEPGEVVDQKNKPEQTKEERSKNAAARRKAEQEAKLIEQRAEETIKAEREKAEALVKAEQEKTAALQAEIDKFYASQALVNPYKNDKPIKSKTDYDEYLLDEAREQIRQGNILPEYVERIAKATSDEKAAKLPVKSETELREEIKAELREEMRIQRLIEKDMDEIGRNDPDLQLTGDTRKDFQAIMARPYGKAVQEQLGKGMTLLNAFNVGAKDWLIEKAKAKAAANAKVKEAGKQHLTPPNGRGTGGAPEMPPETKRMYKGFFPGYTDKQIRELWEKDQAKYGQPKKT